MSASALVMFTVVDSPATRVAPFAPAAVMTSLPSVPATNTPSADPSPVTPPSVPARSALTVVTSVPVRSLTVTVSAPPRALKSTVSTPSVSIVMLATSRKNRSRCPFADKSTCSDAGRAVEPHRVTACLAFDRVAAVARIPDERVVARAHQREVIALVAVDHIVAAAAAEHLDPGASGDVVVTAAAIDRGRDRVLEDAVRLVDAHDVVAAAGVDGELCDPAARDAEVGRAVVADVDLEDVGPAGLQAEGDRGRPRWCP